MKALVVLISISGGVIISSCSGKISADESAGTYVRLYSNSGKKMIDSMFIHKNAEYRIVKYEAGKKIIDKSDTCRFFLPEGITFNNFVYDDLHVHDWDANIEKDTWGKIRIVWNGENDDYYIKVSNE